MTSSFIEETSKGSASSSSLVASEETTWQSHSGFAHSAPVRRSVLRSTHASSAA